MSFQDSFRTIKSYFQRVFYLTTVTVKGLFTFLITEHIHNRGKPRLIYKDTITTSTQFEFNKSLAEIYELLTVWAYQVLSLRKLNGRLKNCLVYFGLQLGNVEHFLLLIPTITLSFIVLCLTEFF